MFMQRPKDQGRLASIRRQPEIEPAPQRADEPDADFDSDTFDTCRVMCPDCAQSIALLAEEDTLPEHALCPSSWDPFGLQVCAGTGRPSTDAFSTDASGESQAQEAALLLTLPQGLDWRTQPFSHVGGPGSRPIQVPQALRRAA
jgi:hypothetical protein